MNTGTQRILMSRSREEVGMPRINALFFVASVGLSLSMGCTFDHKGVGTGEPNPSNFDASAGLDRVFINGDSGSTITGDACPSNNFTANNLPPDLLIVLDRSG